MLLVSRAKCPPSNEVEFQILDVHAIVDEGDFDGLFNALVDFDVSTIKVTTLCVEEQPLELLHTLEPLVLG